MTEGTVVEWCFGIDESVDKGAVLLVIESEKAEIEVEATASGLNLSPKQGGQQRRTMPLSACPLF